MSGRKRGDHIGIGTVREAADSVAADRRPNPFSRLAENLCSVAMIDEFEKLDRSKEIRLALVSMPVAEYKLYDFYPRQIPAGTHEDDYKLTLAAFDEPEKRLRAFKAGLELALRDLRANIVCVSELGLPSSDLIPMEEALRFAHAMSERHNALIVAGTAHDGRTRFNTGYVFHPGGPPDGWPFHKSFSAVTMEERIIAPAGRHVAVIETLGLKIATMICLDIGDYASLAAVMHVADHVDLLLVPCCTLKFEKMLDVARLASKALPGIVALVNCRLHDSYAGPRQIALFGKILEPERVDIRRAGQGRNVAEVALFAFDSGKFQEQRTRLKTNPGKYVNWLFGNRDRPTIRVRRRD
jgi:predicted amidohydrolase